MEEEGSPGKYSGEGDGIPLHHLPLEEASLEESQALPRRGGPTGARSWRAEGDTNRPYMGVTTEDCNPAPARLDESLWGELKAVDVDTTSMLEVDSQVYRSSPAAPYQNWAAAASVPEPTVNVVPVNLPAAVRGQQAPYGNWKNQKLRPRSKWVLPRLETIAELQERSSKISLEDFEALPQRDAIFEGVSDTAKRIVLQWIFDLKMATFGSRWMRVQESRKHPKERLFLKYLDMSNSGAESASAAAAVPWYMRVLSFVDGTMPEYVVWSEKVHNSLLRNFIVHAGAYFRGASQVMLANNVCTGILCHLALGLSSPWLLVCSMIGLFTASEVSFMLGTGPNAWRGGLFGYNGMLVGGAMSIFLAGGDWNALAIPFIIFGAIFSVLVTLALGNMYAPTLGVPPFTLPFIFVTWILIGVMHGSVHFPPIPSLMPGAVNSAPALTFYPSASQFFSAWFSGVAQIYFASSPYSGAVFVIAMAFYSRISALACLLGPLIGMASAMMFGVGETSFVSGLWGYNPALFM